MEHSKIVVISATRLETDTGLSELIRDLDRGAGPRMIVVTPHFGHHMPVPVCALFGVNMLTERLLAERVAINRAPEPSPAEIASVLIKSQPFEEIDTLPVRDPLPHPPRKLVATKARSSNVVDFRGICQRKP